METANREEETSNAAEERQDLSARVERLETEVEEIGDIARAAAVILLASLAFKAVKRLRRR